MSTKAELYKLLKANSGRFVSGQEIASRLELSRTAVWKAVRALEEEGFEIESARSQGYRLVSDAYSQLSLSCGLDIPVCFYDEIDSTNNEARRLLSQGREAPFVVAAVRQTGGKGRRGRSFSSDEGGIYLSVVVPAGSSDSIETVTTRTAVALCRTIEGAGLKPAIKWVNDIYVDRRKAVGILCEGVVSMEDGRISEVVIGVGVNFDRAVFPPELENIASSLFPAGSAPVSRTDFACAEVRNILSSLTEENYADEYRRRCFILGQRISVIKPEGEREAEALDVDDRAHLIVRYDDGSVETLSSGEVSTKVLS